VNIWRAVHHEVRSAWRSMRYDLRRPPGAGKHSGRTARLPVVDPDEQHPAYDAYARRTRRVRTAAAVATMAVGGAAVTYFGVVGGLAALLADETRPPGALPAVSGEGTPGEPGAGTIGGAAARPPAASPSMLPAAPVVPSESGKPSEPSGSTSGSIRTVPSPRRSSSPDPPVPTPAPHPTPTCSETPVPTPSPSPSRTPTVEPSPPPMPPE
jgi:hypothetical protein